MHSRGFTLVEMLAVLTISAILVALALPSFRQIVRSSQISSTSNALHASIDLSRSEAIRRNATVIVCRSLDPENPAPVCSSAAGNGYAANDWSSGWITFAKAPANRQQRCVRSRRRAHRASRRTCAAKPGSPDRRVDDTEPAADWPFSPMGWSMAPTSGRSSSTIASCRWPFAPRRHDAWRLSLSAGRASRAVVNDACPAA